MRALPASIQRWVAVLLPPLAVAVCCFVIIPRQHKLRQVEGQIKVAQAGVQDYLGKLKDISSLPVDPKVATLPLTKQEQSDFLRDLSALCYRTNNRIISLSSLAASPTVNTPAGSANAGGGKDGKDGKKAADPNALPRDVTAIRSTIVFEGRFESVRSFLSGLEQSRRLVSMTECRVVPGHDGPPVLQTVLTVARYVDVPGAAPAATQAASAKPEGPAS